MTELVQAQRKTKRRVTVPQTLIPRVVEGDARHVGQMLQKGKVDLIMTSPPYWLKRDYGHPEQLGQERKPEQFIEALVNTVDSWRPLLKPHASVFINLGDSMRDGVMVGIPTLFEAEMVRRGWQLRSRILWAKRHGLPDPHGRLPQRYEFVFQFSLSTPFVDTFAYSQEFDLSEGNIWHIRTELSRSEHLAPFPSELPRRALLLACPEQVCRACGRPQVRITERGLNLDPRRKQSARALERWREGNLNLDHLRAIRATGICDAGKSMRFQGGAGGNSAEVQKLAQRAKEVLGGYFREFTFALPQHVGWEACPCGAAADNHQPGLVLDPFMGTGTTLRVAQQLRRRSVGVDLRPMMSSLN